MRTAALISVALLAYTWLIYPLGVRLLARARRRRSPRPSAGQPRVSVIVATREPDEAIRARIQDLARTAYPSELIEVIVACDAGRPGPLFFWEEGVLRVATVRGDAPGGKAAALNAAVRAARGEILVFTDTAQQFEPHTIGALVGALASDEALGAASGNLRLDAQEERGTASGLYWRYERWLRRHEARVHSAVGVTGAVYAMPRDLWRPLPAGLILDDLYVPMRLLLSGHRIGFAEEATAHDRRQFSAAEQARRKVRTLTGVLQLCAWLPRVLSPFANPIWIQFVSHKLLRLLTPYLAAIVLSAMAVLYASSDRASTTVWLFLLGVGVVGLAMVANRTVRRLLVDACFMMGATVRASLNAARGDWDVWR